MAWKTHILESYRSESDAENPLGLGFNPSATVWIARLSASSTKAGDDILRFDAVQIPQRKRRSSLMVSTSKSLRSAREEYPTQSRPRNTKAKLVHFPDEIVHPSPLLVIKDDGLSQLNFQDAVRNPILLFQRREGL